MAGARQPPAADIRVWVNREIRERIAQHAEIPALLSLLRVNKASFGLAAASLYREMSNIADITSILDNVPDSVRTSSWLVSFPTNRHS